MFALQWITRYKLQLCNTVHTQWNEDQRVIEFYFKNKKTMDPQSGNKNTHVMKNVQWTGVQLKHENPDVREQAAHAQTSLSALDTLALMAPS